MRLQRFSIFGVKDKFVGTPVSLDLDALGPGLIALVGPNGAGKTTLMEAALASLFKAFASRPGSLYGKMSGRDAYLESLWVDGTTEIKVRLSIDAEGSRTEGYIFVDGQSITTGRATEFDREITRLFGSRELFLASVFAAQTKVGNFLSLPKARRKELFIELLGLSYLTELSNECGQRRRTAEVEVANQRTLFGSLLEEVVDRADLARALGEARGALNSADEGLTAIRLEEAFLNTKLEEAKHAKSRITSIERALSTANDEWQRATAAVDELNGRRAQTVRQLSNQIRSWQDLLEQNDEAKITSRYASRRRSLNIRAASLDATLREESAVACAVEELGSLLLEKARIADRLSTIDNVKQQLADAKASLRIASIEVSASKTGRTNAFQTLKRASELLGQAPCASSNSWFKTAPAQTAVMSFDLASTCPLIADAQNARQQLNSFDESEFERRLGEAEIAYDRADSNVAKLEIHVEGTAAEAKILTERSSETAIRERSLNALIARQSLIENARHEIDTVSQELNGIGLEEEMELDQCRAKRNEANTAISALQSQVKAAETQFDEDLVAARQRVANMIEAVEERKAELEAARSESASLSTVEDDLARARSQRVEIEAQLRKLQDAVTKLTTRIEIIDEKLIQVEKLRTQITNLAQEAGDWAILETALGKDGVQALEIDAAGPEVSAITNELLESCYGPMFSISLETLRAKKSSPGEYSEAFDIRVFKRGVEMDVELLSGGETVIVSEALSLALAIFNTRKSGIRYETLWRDETAGALWPENALAYVDMLRRARELGGYQQVLFVSHQPEVWAASDAQIFVNDGIISFDNDAAIAA